MHDTPFEPPVSIARPEKYRPAIPMRIKFDVLILQEGRCGCGCGAKLGSIKTTQFDHDPALVLRAWNSKDGDTIPAANDPNYIVAKLTPCHGRKTNGAGSATVAGSDIHKRDKSKRLVKSGTAHAETMARKSGHGPVQPVPARAADADGPDRRGDTGSRTQKQAWPRRPFAGNRDGPLKAKVGGGAEPRSSRKRSASKTVNRGLSIKETD